MKSSSNIYVSPVAKEIELKYEGVLASSQVVGGGSESGGFEEEE